MDLSDTCRLCLSLTAEFRDLIKQKDDKTTFEVVNKIDELFQIQSLDDLQLPHVICNICEVKLIECYEFHMMVFKSQQKLLAGLLCSSKNLLEQSTIELDSQNVIEESVKVKENIMVLSVEAVDNVKTNELNIEYLVKVVDPLHSIEINQGQVEETICDKDFFTDQEFLNLEPVQQEEFQKEFDRMDFEDDNRKIKEFYDFSCAICNNKKQFDNINSYRSHMKTLHNIYQAGIQCCKRKLTTRNALLSHLTLHINPDKYKCPQCAKQCRDKEKLKLHTLQYHSPSTDRKYQCDQCPKRFASKFNLTKHSFVHLDDKKKQELKKDHMCDVCGNGFLSKSILAHHYRQMHENKYICVCDVCAKSFKSKGNFINHYQNQHINKFGRRQQCTFCSQWLADKSSLKRHIHNLHNKYGPYICEICNKETPTENALKSHHKYVHLDEKKFACNQCTKAFKKELSLREHIMTHMNSTVGLYQCPFCERSFNSSANMYSHKKKMHPIEYENSKLISAI